MPGTSSRKSVKPLAWPAIWDTSQMASSHRLKDYAIGAHSKHASKVRSRRSHGQSLILPSQLQSMLLMKGSWISTIKFTCPHCLEVHFLDIHLFWSMSGRTSRRLTMRCSTNYACKVGWLVWETSGNQFTISGGLRSTDRRE